MNHWYFLFTLILLSLGCKNYENQARYELNIGEKVKIFYSTNSCCTYCFSSDQNLNNIKFVKSVTIDNGPKGCAGCNYQAAYIFKAISVGIDTVKLKNIAARWECETADIPSEEYIIEVK